MNPVEHIDTELRIKQAAKQVFLRRGLDGARMQDIADEAGVDKALVHYYFRSKDKLFALVFDEIAGSFLGRIGQVLTADVPFADKIRLLIQQDASMPEEFPLVAHFIITELNQSRSQTERQRTVKPLYDAHQLFVKQVEQEINAHTIRPLDPTQLFITLISVSLFPLVAQSLLQIILGLDRDGYRVMLLERGDGLADFINRAIAP
jgi:TetR/AcrR family transcriptional regulator